MCASEKAKTIARLMDGPQGALRGALDRAWEAGRTQGLVEGSALIPAKEAAYEGMFQALRLAKRILDRDDMATEAERTQIREAIFKAED